MDKLKEDIIQDYKNWISQALCVDGRALVDSLGIKQIAVENFTLKLEKLLEIVEESGYDRSFNT